MELHGDVHAVAKLFFNQPQRFKTASQLLSRKRVAARLLRHRVERPDLHRRDAVSQQTRCQLDRFGEKAQMIVAGVVGAYPVARGAAEQLVDRLAHHFARQIPQRHIHGRNGAHLRPGPARVRDGVKHRSPKPVNPGGILA